MTKYREILRLKSLGFSERNIAHSWIYRCAESCFLQALFPQKCRLTSSKLHGEFPHYCISSSGTLSGAGEESLQAYKVY